MRDETFSMLVREQLPDFPADAPLHDDTPLPAYGLDSMGMVILSTALEAAYGFQFSDETLAPSTFATAGTLWRAVAAARGLVREIA